jgi:hypothetical protein
MRPAAVDGWRCVRLLTLLLHAAAGGAAAARTLPAWLLRGLEGHDWLATGDIAVATATRTPEMPPGTAEVPSSERRMWHQAKGEECLLVLEPVEFDTTGDTAGPDMQLLGDTAGLRTA